MTIRRALTGVILLLSAIGPAAAQDQPPVDAPPQIAAEVRNLTRIETWRFFDPPDPAIDPDYTFWGNRSDIDIGVRGRRLDLSGGFAYVRAENLPTDAIGPGGLGTGAFYYAASQQPFSYQVFITTLSAQLHDRDRRRAVTIGRMAYTSGAESVDGAATQSGGLSDVRRLAIDGRLVGTFDWSLYQRRFDGVRADWRGGSRYAGGAAFLVSQGGYEESANLTMDRLLLATGYAGSRSRDAESQVFGVAYRDRRAVDIRPDNSLLPTSSANVTVFALGASHVAVRPVKSGRLDYAAWGAWQGGDWYGQSHLAYAVAAQAGYRWTEAAWSPWVRGGASFASGDGDGRDNRHETFFPMLQETRTWAQSMVYAHANLRDLFLQAHLQPHARVTARLDLHRVDLANRADRWYQGSGATAREGRFFGFSTRQSSGATALGSVMEASGAVAIARYWSVNAYVGRMWGGPVVRGIFSGDRLSYWYVENVLHLSLGS